MSIATQITRIKGLRDRIKSHLVSIGLLQLPQSGGDTPIDRDAQSQVVVGDDLEACADAIDNIEGTQLITATGTTYNVADKQYVRVDDENLIAENIRDGVTILGITGILKDNYAISYDSRPVIKYGGENPPIYQTLPTPPYNAFDTYSFALESGNNLKLKPENVKTGVTINGVTGTFDANDGIEYTEGQPSSETNPPIMPWGSKTIEVNGAVGSGLGYAPYYDGDCINHDNEWVSPAKTTSDILYGSFFLEPYNAYGDSRINCALGPFVDGNAFEQGLNEIIHTHHNYVIIGVEFGKHMDNTIPFNATNKVVLTVLEYEKVNEYNIRRIVCADDTTYELDWNVSESHPYPTLRMTLGDTFYFVNTNSSNGAY